MKKLLSIAAIASAFVAFGAIEIQVGTVGVKEIESDTKDTIVAISYDNLVGATGEMIISNLVKTTNLTKGDQLIAYNGGTYETWVLKEGTGGAKYWEKNTTQYTLSSGGLTAKAGTTASEVSQVWGSGIWLRRQDANSSFYIYGKPNASTVYPCVQGTTLVGNPKQTAQVPTVNSPSNGDVIAVPSSNKLGKDTYTYNSSKTAWIGYNDKGLPTEATLPEIAAGTGFWYIAKGSGTTITWAEAE